MDISAHDRHRLHTRVEEVLGPDDAATLMELLPPGDWSGMASQRDVLAVRDDLQDFEQEMREFRAEMREFKEEMRAFKEEMRDRFEDVRREWRDELRETERRLIEHTDLRVRASVGDSTRLLFFSMLASQATLVGMVIAAVKLG